MRSKYNLSTLFKNLSSDIPVRLKNITLPMPLPGGLKKTFDLQVRFRSIQESLQIIKDNFELFKDIMQYRNSYVLEVIIIILILVEVINLVIEKIM